MGKHIGAMKQITIILITFLTSLAINAQSCYFMSYEDLLEGNGHLLDTLIVKHKGKGKLKHSSNTFVLKTKDKQTDKLLRTGAFGNGSSY